MSSAPLLGDHGKGDGMGAGSKGGGQEQLPWWSRWLGRVVDTEEAAAQQRFAVPMVLTSMAYYGIPLVSVMFSGHLGDVHLAGATLGNSWATVTGYAFVMGLSGALETLLLGFGHNLWAGLFSGSPTIVSEFAAITPLMMISIVLDSAQGVLAGVSRGCGWQHLAAMTNLVAFYLVGMPLAVLFAFKLKFYTKGLWAGLICGVTCQACALLAITVRTKWSKLVEVMQEEKANYVA